MAAKLRAFRIPVDRKDTIPMRYRIKHSHKVTYSRFRDCGTTNARDEDYVHWTPDVSARDKKAWNVPISLYRRDSHRLKHWDRDILDRIYDCDRGMGDATNVDLAGNSGFSFESSSSRFHEPEKIFPESSGFMSYLRTPASSTPAAVGPGSYDTNQTTVLEPSVRQGTTVFLSKSQRAFPREATQHTHMSDPFAHSPKVIDSKLWKCRGGLFSKSKRTVCEVHRDTATKVLLPPLTVSESRSSTTSASNNASRQQWVSSECNLRKCDDHNSESNKMNRTNEAGDSPDEEGTRLPRAVTPRGRAYLQFLLKRASSKFE